MTADLKIKVLALIQNRMDTIEVESEAMKFAVKFNDSMDFSHRKTLLLKVSIS